jgi:Zn-dependent metalloprotease
MASKMNNSSTTKPAREITKHVCCIIPPPLLKNILDNGNPSESCRIALEKTYHHSCKLSSQRKIRNAALAKPSGAKAQGLAATGGGRSSIISPQIFAAIASSSETTDEQKERAQHSLKTTSSLHTARAAKADVKTVVAPKPPTTEEVIHRIIYDSKKTQKLRKTLILDEAKGSASTLTDTDAKNVFYEEVFKRTGIDDDNLKMIGSIHYDDQPGPPGMDNAFWDGDEMAFGDGDGEIFGSFTKNIDVIGHELTHGVVQYTANLAYEFQAGALNESMADVFGTMIKQYFGTEGKTLAKDADWLIGEGIFLPSITNAKALRSMKAPGTAYDNPKVGKDTQPADMDGYMDLPNTDAGDSGGVHMNSGIPNRAFYLAATSLGGYSWEKAGKVWYESLKDETLIGVDSKEAFKVFADLTVKYAKSLFDKDTESKVKEAWTTVKVLTAEKGEL